MIPTTGTPGMAACLLEPFRIESAKRNVEENDRNNGWLHVACNIRLPGLLFLKKTTFLRVFYLFWGGPLATLWRPREKVKPPPPSSPPSVWYHRYHLPSFPCPCRSRPFRLRWLRGVFSAEPMGFGCFGWWMFTPVFSNRKRWLGKSHSFLGGYFPVKMVMFMSELLVYRRVMGVGLA